MRYKSDSVQPYPVTDLRSGILQPRTVRNRSFTTLWRKDPGFWREHTASLALNPGMLQIMRFKIWHLYVQKSYHIMVLLALVLDNLHNSLMALWVMQLSKAYTDKTLVTTLTALYLLQIHACTQKISHIREKTNILRCCFVISATWKRTRLIYVLHVMCSVKHLKKVPKGVKKALSKSPTRTPQQKEYDAQVFSSKTRS